MLATPSQEDTDEESTRITFSRYVRETNPVLNVLGYLADGVCRHSHDSVMAAGEAG